MDNPNGFQNTGAICYFNALISSLIHLKWFKEAILSQGDSVIISEFQRFFREGHDDLFTTRILRLLEGQINGNQSASEYLLYLIEKLKIEKNIERIYTIRRECQNCYHIYKNKDNNFIGLLDENFLELFETKIQIDGFKCEKCLEKVILKETRHLTKCSEIIIISLNKYFEKKDFLYPPFFIIDHQKYTLKATIDHAGVLGGGHYICRVKKNENYFLIDDYSVQQIENIVPIKESYLLFYEKD